MAAVAAAMALAGCSPGVDYPSLFPAVHDMPPPRAETTMNADQIQQATEALISERDRLSAEAQGAAQGKSQSKSPPAAAAAAPPKKPAVPAAQSASAATTTAAAGGEPPVTIAPAAATQTKP